MSKQTNISRKVALESPDKKLSVFDRLGTKSSASLEKNVCRSWAQNGTCSLNKTCKYVHTHVLITSSKHSKAEAMKKQSIVVQKRTGKEEHKKSSRSHHCAEAEWEGWEFGDLEDADEKALEKRKQELQRELQLQLKKEKELTRKKEKRSDQKRASSSSSTSTTSTASSSTTTSSSTSSSQSQKRQNRKRNHGSSSSDSDVSSHRPRKSPRTLKVKVSGSKKSIDKKDIKNSSETRSKSIVVTKKSSVQKKSTSPSWEKSRARTPHSKQPPSKKASPHQSPSDSKNASPSRYDRSLTKSKTRTSPKVKAKESSPKRAAKKVKESSVHVKDKMRPSPMKSRSSPSRAHKVSPSRSRRHDDSEKRRSHYDVRKSPRRERSREKERKKEVRRGHSNENDNGGLKKGGKILPLKPSSYSKDSTAKSKDTSRRKSAEKATDSKPKELECEKEKIRTDKERSDKDKSKSEREKLKHKKGSETHDRHSARDRESDRSALRGRDDRGRDREADRLRIAKEREAERQKERDEALERCRERQRERERLEKERKEKEDKKHSDIKQKDGERELPSLLDLKTENPRGHDSCNSSKASEKHSQRDGRRNIDKVSDRLLNQDRDGRDRERLSLRSQGSPADKDHDRREPRRTDDSERRLSDKDYDSRRNRDSDPRHVADLRRPGAVGRRPLDDPDCRRPWDDVRRVMDGPHDRRRLLEVGLDDRRPHPMLRRAVEDPYDYRRGRDDPDLDVRDFPPDDRRARKLLHGFHHNGQEWDSKAQDLDYREADLRDEWNHSDRLHDWPMRYDHKWVDREESRDSLWNHYSRRPPHDDWKNDWAPEEQSRPLYREPNEDKLEMLKEGFSDHNGRRHNEVEAPSHAESNKELQSSTQGETTAQKWEKNAKAEGDALSDISDDPDDILNQDDETNGAAATSSTTTIATAVTMTAATVSDASGSQNINPPNNDANNNQSSNVNSNSNNNVQKSAQQIYVRNSEFFFDQSRPLLECFRERALDFEEISDEELEEEARANKEQPRWRGHAMQDWLIEAENDDDDDILNLYDFVKEILMKQFPGVMDVLGADWAGLIKDVRPRLKRTEGPVVAHRRWMIDRLISRIGISVKYAGKEFTEALLNKYKDVKQEMKEVKEEIKEEETKVEGNAEDTKEVKEELKEVEIEVQENINEETKKEVKEEENISVNITVKLEPGETETSETYMDEKLEMGITLYHDVPALHYSMRECKNYRSSLFAAHNRFKRALSARTDLSLRRELCNLPSKEPLHFASPLDNKIYENSIKLFQRV